MAVRVDAGDHEIEMIYVSNSFRLGACISGMSWLLALVALAWTGLRGGHLTPGAKCG